MNNDRKTISFLIVSFILLISVAVFLMIFSLCRGTFRTEMYTVGIVNPVPRFEHIIEGFREGLSESGLTEGENIRYIYDGPVRDMPEASRIILEMINDNTDLIFTTTTPVTLIARRLTAGTGVPVVFAPVFDPVKSGVVPSLTDHRSNMTGVKVGGSTEKALEWLITAAPEIKRVFVPYSSDTLAAVESLEALRNGAEKLDVELLISEVRTKDALLRALGSSMINADAVFILNSILFARHSADIINSAIRHRLPAGSGTELYKRGALITYGQNHLRTGRLAGRLAGKILRGTPPEDLPVETSEFFLGINLKTARSIGLDMSVHILEQADFIVR